MKVIEQLSEDKFVIQMEECDLQKEKRIVVAHDYVQFEANMGLMLDPKANWRPTGKFATCANWIKGYFHVQIGIRPFVKVVLPHLLSNKYCKEEHLIDEAGNLNYNWSSTPLIINKERKSLVALKGDDGNYTLIPHEAYMQIKKMVKMEG
jgi:hypothetical protein